MAQVAPPAEPLNPKAQAIYDKLISTRGRIDGMYRTLLNHPDLLDHVSQLGTYFRFGHSSLRDDLREMAILRVASKLGAAYEWVKHAGEGYALTAGLDPAVVEALRQGQTPADLPPTHENVLAVVDCVLELGSIPAELQQSLADELGLEVVLELVVLTGFYRLIAGVVFAFDVPLPPGSQNPFEDRG